MYSRKKRVVHIKQIVPQHFFSQEKSHISWVQEQIESSKGHPHIFSTWQHTLRYSNCQNTMFNTLFFKCYLIFLGGFKSNTGITYNTLVLLYCIFYTVSASCNGMWLKWKESQIPVFCLYILTGFFVIIRIPKKIAWVKGTAMGFFCFAQTKRQYLSEEKSLGYLF